MVQWTLSLGIDLNLKRQIARYFIFPDSYLKLKHCPSSQYYRQTNSKTL